MSRTRKMTTLAILSAIAFVAMFIGRFSIVPALSFLHYDPKDIVLVITGLFFGPLSAFLVIVVVSVVEMFTVSTTGPIGLIMNILSSGAFACTAALIYKKRRNAVGAGIGVAAGTVMMVIVMLLWNYLITPMYMNVPREYVAELLLPAFLPFNLIKGGLNATITMLVYKPLMQALRKAGVLPSMPEERKLAGGRGVSVGVMITSAVVLATCVLSVLVFQGTL